MEAPAATSIDSQWFRPNDDDEEDDDAEPEGARAIAMRHAALCVSAVTRLLGASSPRAEEQMCVVLRNCVALWRAKFKVWQTPCGNHLNVPDALFVAACHLRVALMPEAMRHFSDLADVLRLEARITSALREWDRAAAIHDEHHSIVNECARAIVFWGSGVAPSSRIADTTLSLEDVSFLTMNVNVHQNLDNRARNTDSSVAAPATASVADACRDDEHVLASFVRLASRYAFFAMLHHAARLPCPHPRLSAHQRIAAEAVRPPPELVDTNVTRMYTLFRERSRVSMPEVVQRDITLTIWKRLLSVGSMEASGWVRARFHHTHTHVRCSQEYLRMAPTIDWHRVNPVTVSIREPTAATVAGSLARTVAMADYQDAAECPDFLRICHRESWHLALWNQMFTEIDMHFLEDYVVLAHDIRHKAVHIGSSTRNWRPRLPVIVRACGTWCVHALSIVWRADTLEECLYLWTWIVVRFFDCRNETGASLHQILQRAELEF